MSKKINQLPAKISGYFSNNNLKSFDFTMNRVYNLLDKEYNTVEKKSYMAIIISGQETGDNSTFQFDNSKVFLSGREVMSYKIRFIEEDERYNVFPSPYNNNIPASERLYYYSSHPSAYYEINGDENILSFNTLVQVEKEDLVYKIVKTMGYYDPEAIEESGYQSASDLFENLESAPGFLKDFFLSAKTSLNEPEVPFTGRKRYSKETSIKMEGTTFRPYVRKYTGKNQKYNNTDIENGIKISDFHVKVVGYTRGHNPTFVPDIVENFKKLCNSFEAKFGEKIKLTDGFRTWKGQTSVRKKKPTLAAKPGTSNHGWGLAFDWDTKWNNKSGFRSETYKWMFENAPKFGFHNPSWARPNGSKPEAWHFEWKFPGNLFK